VERRTALPLQRRQIFATQDAEEARAFLGARGFLLDIPSREATDLDMRLKSVFLPGLLFTRLEYGAAVQVRTAENYEDYRFVAPLRGRLCGTIANEDVPCRPGAAMLVSPTLDNLLRVERDTAGLNVLLSGFMLRRHLVALLGEPFKGAARIRGALEFAGGARTKPRALSAPCRRRIGAARLDFGGANSRAVIPRFPDQRAADLSSPQLRRKIAAARTADHAARRQARDRLHPGESRYQNRIA